MVREWLSVYIGSRRRKGGLRPPFRRRDGVRRACAEREIGSEEASGV